MPKLSLFTPCGMLRLNSGAPHGKTIHRSLINSLGDQYDMTEGSRMDGWCYATAMGLARVRYIIDRAVEQHLPTHASHTLPKLEASYSLVPLPGDTVADRRAALADAWALIQPPTQVYMETELAAIWGANFVMYRPTPNAEVTLAPPVLGDQPMNLQLPNIQRKTAFLYEPVSIVGARTVFYTLPSVAPAFSATGERTDKLQIGDVLTVQPETDGLTEVVTVTGADPGAQSITATFTKSHDIGAVITTIPYPQWASTKRYSLIVVDDVDAALDPARVNRTHEFMRKHARGVSRWAIVVGNATQTTQYLADAPGSGVHTIGTVTF